MDEIETLALDLGSKLEMSQLQTLAKLLTFIVYGRGIERNGSNATAAPEKAAPTKAAAKGKTPRPPLPAADDDEPGF